MTRSLKQYVGLDVSLDLTSIAVVDENDQVVWRGSVVSTPDAITEVVQKHAKRADRVGLEAGQLSAWLYHGLRAKGLPVICIDARHAKAALSLKTTRRTRTMLWASPKLCGSAGIARSRGRRLFRHDAATLPIG